MPLILKLLRAYLGLGVTPPDDSNGEPDPVTKPDPPPDDDLPDLDAADDEPDGDGDDPPAEDHQALARAATARAEKAEREAREAREALAASEGARRAPAPNQEQQAFEQEEARLRAADITPTERWQIESNRTLRASRRAAEEALWNSREQSDRSAFRELIAQRPVAKKYEKRVEEKLTEIRKGGHNLERKLVLAMLIGTDIVDGKVKTKAKPAAADDTSRKVDRGTPPHARSDVRGKGNGNSEREKRNARLANQTI